MDDKNEQLVTMDAINPQIAKCPLGIKKLRQITIYPLSVRDQMNLSGIIVEGISEFYKDGEEKSDVQVAVFVSEFIKNKLEDILKFVVDEEEVGDCDVFAEMTNLQAVMIVEVIFNINYGNIVKKVKDLIKTAKGAFLSTRSSATSLNDTPNTDSETSSEEASEKEE